MQKSNKIRVTILTIAAVLTAAVILAIACAPAEPTSRSNGDEATQPYQNTENESVGQQAKPEWTPPPPPTGPAVKPVVNTNLQRKLAKHVENKANKRAAGENLPTVYVELVITVAEPKHVDELVEFMNEHATGDIILNKYDGTNRNVNGTIARIDLDLVPTVEAMPGVIEIYEVIPAQPASQRKQGAPTLLKNGYPIVLKNRHRGHILMDNYSDITAAAIITGFIRWQLIQTPSWRNRSADRER